MYVSYRLIKNVSISQAKTERQTPVKNMMLRNAGIRIDDQSCQKVLISLTRLSDLLIGLE